MEECDQSLPMVEHCGLKDQAVRAYTWVMTDVESGGHGYTAQTLYFDVNLVVRTLP